MKTQSNGMWVKMLSIVLMTTMLFFCLHTQAQEQQTSAESNLRPKLGIKGGVNFTSLYVANVTDEHMKTGFNAGIFAKFPITTGFSIQPELLYSTKGAKDSYSNFAQGSGEYRFNLNYIELPVLAVVNLARHFNLHAGGYAAYLVGANVKNVDNHGTITGATELNADNFHRWDLGIAGGLGFDVENFTIGARYNYGLSNIGKSGSLSGDLTQNSKNAGVSVYLGFGF
ncbi:MAG TPA: porin family protein [Puia sp.]|nr:porin family protein [Puia sp.]